MSTIDYSKEPETIWKTALLKHQNETFYIIFNLGDLSRAWEMMIGWIGTLNLASQQSFEAILRELENAVLNHKPITASRTWKIFRLVSLHTYECYLSKGGFGMVQSASLKKTQDAPSEVFPDRVSAKLR